jgi:hypothetical protein
MTNFASSSPCEEYNIAVFSGVGGIELIFE